MHIVLRWLLVLSKLLKFSTPKQCHLCATPNISHSKSNNISSIIMDLEILKNFNFKCFEYEHDDVNINGCSALRRILHGLKYYAMLNLDNISSNHDVFISFCHEIYPSGDVPDTAG